MDSVTATEARGFHWLVPEPPSNSFMGLARHIAGAGIAGLFTGVLVGGVGGRLFMRIAGAAAPDRVQGFGTEAGFTVGEVTFGGSLALVIFIGVFTGIAGAILYVVFTPWIAWAKHWRGALFGVVLFGVASATSDIMNPDNFDFSILENPVLLVSLIAFLFLSFGLAIDVAFRYLDERLPGSADNWGGVAPVYVTLTLLGLVALIPIVGSTVDDSICDCGPPVVASWSVVVAAIGTAMWWATALFGRLPGWSRAVAVAFGYTGLVGALLFGLARAAADAFEIIG